MKNREPRKGLLGIADTMHQHAAKCKRDPNECHVCQANMKHFASQPLPMLSEALADARAAKMPIALATMAVENLILAGQRSGSKRQKANFNTAFVVLKGFQQRGGSFNVARPAA